MSERSHSVRGPLGVHPGAERAPALRRFSWTVGDDAAVTRAVSRLVWEQLSGTSAPITELKREVPQPGRGRGPCTELGKRLHGVTRLEVRAGAQRSRRSVRGRCPRMARAAARSARRIPKADVGWPSVFLVACSRRQRQGGDGPRCARRGISPFPRAQGRARSAHSPERFLRGRGVRWAGWDRCPRSPDSGGPGPGPARARSAMSSSMRYAEPSFV